MEQLHLAYMLALAVGIVSSGLVASAWELATDEKLRLGDVMDANPTIATPLRVLATLLSAPTIVLLDGFWWLIAQPVFGLLILAAGFVWSFLQGVFILTQVFGFS
jgi:hypothetical protein